MARNTVVQKFLATGIEWLYMADTDTMWDSRTIPKLLSNNKAAVSGLVMQVGEPPFPLMFRRIADFGFKGAGVFQQIHDYTNGELLQVDAVGAGSLLVHRDAFLAIAKQMPRFVAQWFEQESVGDNLITEDFTFCIRLAKAGIPMYVDTGATIGHLKTVVLRALPRAWQPLPRPGLG